ncbi:MAG TPA: YaaR family protein [Halanaerobiaceae bacterium]|jgi:uncharacterized protein YaaR (DUF327 family)|nr:YaaR family protein [Bacillota bacterium]HHU92383.1 YaaR family protein [Halanaerobiaceae bacterium]HOA39903.1 YaaR family protein [Halanaerobiales bacterium]HPZ61978.1 YaaR family protein [Halanaerobiales bacterium]HQD03299.1 YaaR family protein [Halanaerobiales bacterium]
MKIGRMSTAVKSQEKAGNINSVERSPRKEVQFKEKLDEINQQEIKERLDKLFNIIDEQGEKLKKSLDKKDLMEYKRRVKEFLRILNKEFARAKQSFSWDSRGNMRTYTIVEKINGKLETLQDLFLEEQADALEVLKRVDEIRGLLLDLYI